MHPIFSHARNLLAVAGLWLALSGMITYLLYLQSDISLGKVIVLFSPLLFIYFFFCLSNFYICIKLPIRQTYFLRLISTQFIAMTVTLLSWIIFGFAYVYLLNKTYPADWLSLYQELLMSMGITGAMLYCFWILAHYIYLMAQQHDEIQRTALKRKLLISQTELLAIKATVHPHFMYNSLNMIANLALVEPKKVHSICLQISEFLRYSVSYSRQPMATVGDELDHIQNYLGIERERFGPRLQIEFKVDETIRSEPILPLLLFPLVENSIKHGIDSSLEGGTVEICMEKKPDKLFIQITNPYDELGVKQNGTNLGLDAVKKRIRAHYGDRGKVDITREPGKFSISLSLPTQGALE